MNEDVTQLLAQITAGQARAADELLPLVYGELRRLAERYLQSEDRGHTLQATALVHEAYLRLVNQDAAHFNDRAHFFSVAAQAMRRVLVDHARGRGRVKRGGGEVPQALDTDVALAYEGAGGVDLIELDDALVQLGQVSPQAVRVVEMRYFGGLTVEETAVVVGVSVSSIERDWRFARAWLYQRLGNR